RRIQYSSKGKRSHPNLVYLSFDRHFTCDKSEVVTGDLQHSVNFSLVETKNVRGVSIGMLEIISVPLHIAHKGLMGDAPPFGQAICDSLDTSFFSDRSQDFSGRICKCVNRYRVTTFEE